MRIIIELKYQSGDDPKYTKEEIRDALVNTEWNPGSENPHYHSACARRRDIRMAIAQGAIQIEYTLSRDECIELLTIEQILAICTKYGFMERDIAELATWTKAGVKDYIARKMNTVRIDWAEIWDEMRKLASRKVANG